MLISNGTFNFFSIKNLLNLTKILIFYSLYSKSALNKKTGKLLKNIINNTNTPIYLYISGRSSLYAVLKYLKGVYPAKKVLIPDYTCNVIHKAIESAGLHFDIYPTNNFFEPNISEIVKKVDTDTLAIVGANIFGSEGLSVKDIKDVFAMLKCNPVVIHDCAQNIEKINKINDKELKQIAVFSFNDKDIWSIMGGGFASNFDIDLKNDKKVTLRHEFLFLRRFIKKLIYSLYCMLAKRGNCSLNEYDYSDCKSFVFSINDFEIAKISLACGIVGLGMLKKIKQQRIKNYNYLKTCLCNHGIEITQTKEVEYSPYIPFNLANCDRTILNSVISIKSPYARYDNPEISDKSSNFCFHNNYMFDYSKIKV